MSPALFGNGAKIGDIDRSVVRNLDADACAYQCAFGNLFSVQRSLEFLFPAGNIDNSRVPLSIDREIHECRRIIQNHRLLKPSPNGNENTQRQNFWNSIGLVLESQILSSPIDPRRRKNISTRLGTQHYRELGAPKLNANTLSSTRWRFVAVLKRVSLPSVFNDRFTTENYDHPGRCGGFGRRRGLRRRRRCGSWRNLSHALFGNGAKIGDIDRSVVRNLDADACAYQCAFGNLFSVQRSLEFLFPAGNIDNSRVPLSIDREIHECRRIIQNHRLLKPSPNGNENTQRQNFWNSIGLVLESQILCSPIDPRGRKDISAGLGPNDYREFGTPKLDTNALTSTRWRFVAVLKRVSLPVVFNNRFTTENHHILHRSGAFSSTNKRQGKQHQDEQFANNSQVIF